MTKAVHTLTLHNFSVSALH